MADPEGPAEGGGGAPVRVPGQRPGRRSPAAHLERLMAEAGSPGTAVLRELPFLAQVEIRVDEEETAAASRMAEGFLGCALPAPGRSSGTGSPYVLHCGPGWYLVVDAEATGPGLAAGLRAALGGEYGGPCAAVADLSAQRAVFELRGPQAAEVIARGCPLDLHPRAFGTGGYAQSLLGRAAVGVHRTGPEGGVPEFRLLVRASFAEYLARFLADALHGAAPPHRVG
ncbi:hypothetical protein J0910_10880 [Nocardiopsis sp. CNT-189]|uniref:sarcosine oxidase subunit gamma n=1 Tax=Nocardiopsis oceanisediminis TaxID=2816862 RepID=UPI003B2BAF39